MAKISKEGGPTVKGTMPAIDMNAPVTLGMLSRILDYLELAVYMEGPGGPLSPSDPLPSDYKPGKGMWIGFRGYR
jgi:hypothetical protein